MRFVSVPLSVIEEDLLLPETNVIPVVDPVWIVPSVDVSVICCSPLPALTSATLIGLPFAVEKTNDPFSATEAVAGAVMVGVRTLTVKVTLSDAESPSPGSTTETPSESNPEYPVVGLYVSPLSPAFRFATVPVTVIDTELLAPAVTVKPLVVANFSVPWATESVSDSVLLVPAFASVNETALLLAAEKTSELFSFSEAEVGAVIKGAVAGVTVIATLVEDD